MKSYTTPDGSITITWPGGIEAKIALLAEEGYTYTPTPEELEEVENIERIKNEYASATTRLQQIIDFSGTVTLTILGNAVKDIAQILLLLLKLLRRQYT